jgi:hypothetical protein
MNKILVKKHPLGRMPVQSKAGTGLNASGLPYAPVKNVGAIRNNLQRKPIGSK